MDESEFTLSTCLLILQTKVIFRWDPCHAAVDILLLFHVEVQDFNINLNSVFSGHCACRMLHLSPVVFVGFLYYPLQQCPSLSHKPHLFVTFLRKGAFLTHNFRGFGVKWNKEGPIQFFLGLHIHHAASLMLRWCSFICLQLLIPTVGYHLQ